LDVGQGDSIYIRTPDNQDIVIDGGPDNTVLSQLGTYMPFYDRKIELMILTHPHEDHINGLIEMLDKYQVDRVLAPSVSYDSASVVEWEHKLSTNNIAMTGVLQGQTIGLGASRIEIISPNQELLQDDNVNNASIVLKYIYGNTKLVLTGDAEEEAEEYMVRSGDINLQADLLKVGHHGSKTSSTESFLDLVKPEYAIISVGASNKFNHPSSDTIEKLEEREIEYFRTDFNGTIICISDAQKLSCSPEKF
jgi:beta-lactamase superfamily II metal-dependent hydrolase